MLLKQPFYWEIYKQIILLITFIESEPVVYREVYRYTVHSTWS